MEQEIILNEHNKQEYKRVCLKDVKKSIYKDFFSHNEFVIGLDNRGLLYPTVWRGKESCNSLTFKEKNKYRRDIPNILIEIFDIKNKDLFLKKYNEAIMGDGNEWTRITTLHSSSLLTLLCFYSVSKDNPLSIGSYIFEESFFEVKTQVYQDSESNMDVVLSGKDKVNGQKVVLFLESKFTEYLSCGKCDGISRDAYYDKYDELSLFNEDAISYINIRNTSDNKISIQPKNSKENNIYCTGIKQMLSHYIGVRNYAMNKNLSLGEHLSFEYIPAEKILLGEILYDFKGKVGSSSKKMNNYRNVYSELAERINSKQNEIMMLGDIMTYQDVFSNNFIKEKNIRDFYNLN